MGRQPRERILGPYADGTGGSWKIVHVDADGGRTSRSCPSKEAAEEAAREARALIGRVELKTCQAAIETYETYLREQKRLKPRSIAETVRRLRVFLPSCLLRSLTPEKCSARYAELAAKVAVDTHRNTLNETKTFLRWCVQQRWISASPVEGLKGVGRRRRGKPQLRLDEARKWSVVAFRLADQGEPGAVAALTTLYMDLRASEVTGRQVRDLDDGGRVLWIPDAKSDAGRRVLEIPEVLQPYLRQLAAGKESTALLFGGRTRKWVWHWVAKLCDLAKVPRVGAHSMRGLHASLAVERGATGHQVALAMGHSSPAVTFAHYAKREAVASARQAKVVDLMERKRFAAVSPK